MPMTATPPAEGEQPLLTAFGDYLAACGEKSTFPNLAGFCRHCGFSRQNFTRKRERYPEVCGLILAALEDEALNADKSASLVTAYLRHRLGYGAAAEEAEPTPVAPGLLRDGE